MILRIQALLLAFILISPIVFTSVTKLGNTDYQAEVCDNLSGEDREERESEKEKDGIEECVLRRQNQIKILSGINAMYASVNNLMTSVNTDVLTPPPEYI